MKKTFLRSLVMAVLIVIGCLAANAKELVPFGITSNQPWEGKYLYALRSAEEQAPENWYAADFDDTAWGTVTGPIDTGSLSYSNTSWPENYSSYWVRTHFTIDELSDSKTYTFYVAHDDECVAYINGVQIYTNTSVANYSTVRLSGDAVAALKKGDNVLCVYVSDSNGGNAYMDFGLYESDLQDVIAHADVPVTITNDPTHPWWVEDIYAVIRGNNQSNYYAASWLTFAYSSTERTEVSFEWASYNYGYHDGLQLYIDGVYQTNRYHNTNYTSMRYYLEPGEHIVAFRDSANNYNYSGNWSAFRNFRVKEVKPLETVVLTENSQPLTFTNNSATPWTTEDGYIEHGNWCRQRVGASFSTTFTVEKTSKLSFNYKVANYNYDNSYNYEGAHNLFVYINGIQITKAWNNINDTYWCVVLEPGDYTVEWKDTVYTDYADWINYYSHIKDIELSNNWIDVNLVTAGTLGYEALYSGKANVLTDVEFLKVSGPMNDADWTDIKNMTNLLALDLSEAEITEIPNYAFDGKGWLNSVIMPEGITRIGEYAFRGTSIRRVNIPSTVATINQFAFAGCPLQSVDFSGNETLTTINNAAFYNCSVLQKVAIPNSVTSMGYAVFQDCSSLKSITFPEGISFINDYMCSGCVSLEQVQLPENLVRINYAAFNVTSSLKKIVSFYITYNPFRKFFISRINYF